MAKLLLTTSRYNQPRYIEDIDFDRGVFHITGESRYMRMACEPDTNPPVNTMYDFEGGPCIHLDDEFFGMGYITHISACTGGVEITLNYNEKFKKKVKKVLSGKMTVKDALDGIIKATDKEFLRYIDVIDSSTENHKKIMRDIINSFIDPDTEGKA